MIRAKDQAPRFYGGIDSGSWNTKAAVVDGSGEIVATAVVRTAADLVAAAGKAVEEAVERGALVRADLAAVWSTGFGRHVIPFADATRTELDCHARGVLCFYGGPLTVVDIGGQDAKVIRLDAAGRRVSHRLNRKCAAGTGSFLEEMALRLDVPVEGLPGLAAAASEELELGSFCTVFAGTELLAAIRNGKKAADLVRAAYRSVVKRVLEMERIEGPVVATGGVVAHHPMVVELMCRAISAEVRVPPFAQEMGAIGAAQAARASGAQADAAGEGGG